MLLVGGARPIMGALGVLVAHYLKLPDEVRDILKSRLVRPEMWFLTELSAEARQTTNVLQPLTRLLRTKGYAPNANEFSVLERELTRLTAGPSC